MTVMLNNIKVVLFDLDGTIADTNNLILHSLMDTLGEFTGRSWSADELLPYWGIRLLDQLQCCAPEIILDDAVAFYRRCYLALQPELLQAFPGVIELLDALSQRDIQLGVVTSKKRQMALYTLEMLQMQNYFTICIADEDTVQHKPHPEPLIFACNKLGVATTETLYVGDNPDDVRAAHAANMPAAVVSWSLRPMEEFLAVAPEIIIDHPSELLAILRPAVVAV